MPCGSASTAQIFDQIMASPATRQRSRSIPAACPISSATCISTTMAGCRPSSAATSGPLNGHFAVYYVLSMEGLVKSWVIGTGHAAGAGAGIPGGDAERVPAAVWYERELRDMFGIQPVGLPDERRLVLPTTGRPICTRCARTPWITASGPSLPPTKRPMSSSTSRARGSWKCPLGPLHVTSDEPGHFRLYVDGEYIVDADYRLFYVHRGMEKLAETRMNYDQITFLADRICGICGYAHNVAYSTSIERRPRHRRAAARPVHPHDPAGNRAAAQPPA